MKYILTLLLLVSSYTFGCSCAFPTIKDSYQNSDAIFIGKVIAVDSSKYDYSSNTVYAYTFEIEKDFKRELSKQNSKKYYTTIYTPLRSLFGSCGMTFNLNESYLIYGYPTSFGVSTSICTRTDALNNVSEEEINLLTKLKDVYIKSNEIILTSYENDDIVILSKEFDLYQLTAERKEKYYWIGLGVLGILLIVSLGFNFRKS